MSSTLTLDARRQAAAARLSSVPLPEFKGKAGWEFTPLGKLDLDALPAAASGDTCGVELLFEPDGAVGLSTEPAVSEGPIVMPLAAAIEQHPELVGAHLGTVVESESALVVRNDERWTDGAFVYVPRNVAVAAPILISSVHEQTGTALYTRTLVVLEEGAEAEVWDQTLSGGAGEDGFEGLVNGVVELVVGQNARLRYVGGQDLNEKTWMFGTQRAVVERDGHLDWVTLGFGGKDGKVFLETKLAGPGAHAAVTGAYATRGRQHVDFDTLQEHAAVNTTSDLAFRGILDGRSTAVWRGMIQVDRGAQQTDAFQECRNLLLSKKAHADAIPGLEILADDVRCTHAAAIAQIDAEQLFYLQSHGLPKSGAHRLVVEGFLGALLDRFAEGTVREAVASALDRRLAEVLG